MSWGKSVSVGDAHFANFIIAEVRQIERNRFRFRCLLSCFSKRPSQSSSVHHTAPDRLDVQNTAAATWSSSNFPQVRRNQSGTTA